VPIRSRQQLNKTGFKEMDRSPNRYWLLKSQIQVVDAGWEKFLDHIRGEDVWMILPRDIENIAPQARHYFRANMFGDGEINVTFLQAKKKGGWLKGEVFYFSKYRFERYSTKSINIVSNMNALLADQKLPGISDEVAAEIEACLIGDWQPIDPHDSRKRFW